MIGIDCQEADVLAAAMSVGSVDEQEQSALETHLGGCATCRRAANEYLAAAARLPLVLQPIQPSPELRSRLMRAVYAEAAAQDATVREARVVPVQRAVPGFWQRIWAAVPAGRGFTLLGAAAAILLIGVGSFAGLHRATPAPQPEPAAVRIALSGQAAAPNAHGTLVYSRDTQTGVISVTGLPGPAVSGAVGSVYEVWLIPARGATVAAAFLTQGPAGTWTAAVQGDLSHYATMATTVEPSRASASPTGPAVLQGSMAGV